MSTKRKLDTNAVVADGSDAIAKESEKESPKHDKSEENEENQPSKKRKLNNKSENESNSAFGASKGFALTDFTFSNEASNTGFTGLGFGSNTSSNDGTNNNNGFSGFGSFGTFGGMSGTCGFGFGGNNDENKSNDKKDETNNCATKDENGATNSISAWSTNATETKKWTFGDTSSFSFGNDKNSSFGNFGGFDSGFKSGFGNFNKGDNNNDGNDDGNDDNNDKNEQSSNKEENDSEYGNFNKNVAKCEMTGERDRGDSQDITHFSTRAKIYKLTNGRYAERGIGELKVNSVKYTSKDKEKEKDKDNNENNENNENEKVIDSARLLCRREQTLKLILNEFIQKNTKFEIENKKFLRVSFVSPKSENKGENEENENENDNSNTNEKSKEKSKEGDDDAFTINTYLIRPADVSKLEDLKDSMEIVQEMLEDSENAQ